jgi:hypothetical protein
VYTISGLAFTPTDVHQEYWLYWNPFASGTGVCSSWGAEADISLVISSAPGIE